MKVFLTGKKGVGKSTCINEVIKECRISVCGFQTLPFYEAGVRKGFYMHSLIEIAGNDRLFSHQHETSNETIPAVFDTFGVQVLQKSQKYQNQVMILDEIGYLEHGEFHYLSVLRKTIHQCNNIIGVLRKCDIKYIVDIRQRTDVLVLDFDLLSYQEIKQRLLQEVEEWK